MVAVSWRGGWPAACFPESGIEGYSRTVQRFVLSAMFVSSLTVMGCAPKAPPRWAEGGSVLFITPARWDRPDEDSVEIQPDGRVVEGGRRRFVIDRVGRVTDDDYEPFAVLQPDGHLVGTDDAALGYVGLSNASPPSGVQAWLSLQPDGRVVFFEPNGDRTTRGVWHGCDGPGRRACTLVTQIFAVRNYRMQPASGVTFGVGVGMGVGF
jgi:hypothetical protein